MLNLLHMLWCKHTGVALASSVCTAQGCNHHDEEPGSLTIMSCIICCKDCWLDVSLYLHMYDLTEEEVGNFLNHKSQELEVEDRRTILAEVLNSQRDGISIT